ncbi:hypothetical protein CQW23_24176 [Capsicum baccatum]|uniref:Uncharacterized protein n=1 Tax=Capsicum baccatum TaxID=33114 RepID=A0A2G2VU33_CAPBA|nr:hypothetical protein CQW23_24176 [Capsicum baccatum]
MTPEELPVAFDRPGPEAAFALHMALRSRIDMITIDTPDWTCKVHIVDISRERKSPEKQILFQNLLLEDAEVPKQMVITFATFRNTQFLLTLWGDFSEIEGPELQAKIEKEEYPVILGRNIGISSYQEKEQMLPLTIDQRIAKKVRPFATSEQEMEPTIVESGSSSAALAHEPLTPAKKTKSLACEEWRLEICGRFLSPRELYKSGTGSLAYEGVGNLGLCNLPPLPRPQDFAWASNTSSCNLVNLYACIKVLETMVLFFGNFCVLEKDGIYFWAPNCYVLTHYEARSAALEAMTLLQIYREQKVLLPVKFHHITFEIMIVKLELRLRYLL